MRIVLSLGFSIALCMLISCQRHPKFQVEVERYLYTTKVVSSPDSSYDLNAGLVYGKVLPITVPDTCQAEANMIMQAQELYRAMLQGDFDGQYKFLYPDTYTYLRKIYSDFPDGVEGIKEFLEEGTAGLQKDVQGWKQNDIDYWMIVSNLERKIMYGDDIIIIFDIMTNMCSEDVFVHSDYVEKTIGVSRDGGRNWWFISVTEDLPAILKMHYSADVVNAVMDY